MQVAAVQGGLLAVQAQGEGPPVGVEGEDLAAAAIGHTQRPEGVLAADHQIPDREAAVADLEAVAAEVAGVVSELLAGGVELIDLLAAVGQDGDPVPVLEGLPPVAQHELPQAHVSELRLVLLLGLLATVIGGLGQAG